MADDGRGLRDESDSRPFCELCGALENLKLCSGCERSYYCNREHQLTNWKRHKPKCGGRRRSAAVRRKADDNGELAKADDMAGGGGRLSTEPADADGRRPGQSRTHDGPDMRQTAAEQSAADSSNLLRDISHGARDINSPVVERSGGIQPYLTGDGTEDLTSSTTTTYDQSLDYELDAVGLPASINGQLKSRPMRVTMAPDPSNSSQAADIGYHDAVSMKKTRSFVDCPEHGGQALVTAYKSSDSCEQKMTGMTLQSRGTIAKVSSEPTFGTVRHACHTRVSSVENLSVRDVGATAERPGASKEENVFKIPNSVDHKGKRKITDCKPSSDLQESTKIQQEETRLADYVVKCLNDYGMCVVDTFMGEEKGTRILNEVRELQQHDELFHEGQTAQGQQKGQEIRGDKIAWVEKDDPHINYIGMLIARLDALMLSCSRRLGHYHINGRTKAMVACYPGQGKGYKCHVDNPNGDGRCVTCIYYVNKDWDIQKYGGLLRIFPTMFNYVADIIPKFDRLLFFWSDRRNPHEVQPAFRPRLAITVWYFDAEERKKAKLQYAGKGSSQSGGSGGSQVFEIQKNQ